MRRRDAVDPSIYLKALAVLAQNPLIAIFPLLAALIEIALGFLRGPLFDPLGGNDFGIFGLVFKLIDGFAFALAIIAAQTAWSNRRPTIASTWNEGKSNAASILLATLGFFFMLYVAAMAGNILGPIVGLAVQVAALFFLIYTIPAAAIGGVPGGAALSASIERVRRNYLGAAVLAIVAVALYALLVQELGVYLPFGIYAPYAIVFLKSVVIAYLGVVFARQYEDVGFFRPY
ncbi:MAG: hypothetical protein NVS9B12_12540 [Vulcanimicrobiaceae bacterium]